MVNSQPPVRQGLFPGLCGPLAEGWSLVPGLFPNYVSFVVSGMVSCFSNATQTEVLRPHSLYIRICILIQLSGVHVLVGRTAPETCSLLHFANIWPREAVLVITSSVKLPEIDNLTGLWEYTYSQML